ncbi:MAG: PhoH family protein [Spirochaetales bacterium]|nr:PhoH family protein [Spirochaetales bacterium]
MGTSFVFGNPDAMRSVCGINDTNIPYLEKLLGCSIYVRGDRIECQTEDSASPEVSSELFSQLLERLSVLSGITNDISEPEILMEFKAIKNAMDKGEASAPTRREFISVLSKAVYPKSNHQEQYIHAMNNSQITFGIGPAGTGKTYLAVAHCLGELLSGRKQKLILTRPVVEAGESLGFLPGDLSQKLNPYLKPLYDSMEALIAPATIRRLEDSGSIEIAPLAYMRGRSIHNACIILDEAQNTTQAQMKMFLTRIGENSCAIITGDVTQIDLPKTSSSGLVQAREILRDIEGIEFVNFTARDTVRSRIVQRIIDAYEKN